jgi:DNA-directed RNA polymerase specialized sigma24 family protein
VTTPTEQRTALVRLARRHSLCAADADDAVQRAFEILLRRAERVHSATALSWLRTVVWRTIRT